MKKLLLISGLASGAIATAVAAPPLMPMAVERLQTPQTTGQQRPTQLDLALSNPSASPRLGLPNLVVASPDAELDAVLQTVTDVLWADLEFEREFYMIPRGEVARIPSARRPEDVSVAQWRRFGADYVIHAVGRRAGAQFEVDFRLLSTQSGAVAEERWGSRYSGCTMDKPRACAHYIADDFHKQTRALDGVAQTRIAFVSDRDAARNTTRLTPNPGNGKEVYISDYDGANAYRVTANQSLNISPVWSPDARSLAYTSWESGSEDIYLVHPFGGGARTRPAQGSPDVRNVLPSFSPDGTRVAYASSRAGSYDIWVVNVDGSGRQNLTPNTPRSDENAPTWSPDGRFIAFTSDRTGTNQIWYMGADGVPAGQRINSGGHSDRPTWSPLNYIAFTLTTGGGSHDVAVYNFESQQVSVLTDGVGTNEGPSVAPNGRHIAFVTSRWGRAQVAVMDYPTGANIRRVTDAGTNTYPNWSPAPNR